MIRPATVDDILPIFNMVEGYYREAIDKRGYPLKWDREKVVIYLGNLLYRDTALNFIAENGEGVILGEVAETWFGPNVMAQPHILYVKPEHRNGLIARALLRRFEKEALKRKALFVLWEFESGVSDADMLSGLMKCLHYEFQGPIYRKTFWG